MWNVTKDILRVWTLNIWSHNPVSVMYPAASVMTSGWPRRLLGTTWAMSSRVTSSRSREVATSKVSQWSKESSLRAEFAFWCTEVSLHNTTNKNICQNEEEVLFVLPKPLCLQDYYWMGTYWVVLSSLSKPNSWSFLRWLQVNLIA